MLRTFTFSPDSAWLYYWRILITFGVLYTIFYIPFEVAFDPALAATSLLITDCVHAIFIADMVIVATTAFRENGKLIDAFGQPYEYYLSTGTNVADQLAIVSRGLDGLSTWTADPNAATKDPNKAADFLGTAPSAAGPMIIVICWITPLAMVFSRMISPYLPTAITPS